MLVKAKDWGSQEASTLLGKSFSGMWVGSRTSQNDRSGVADAGVHATLESRTHVRAEAVHNCAASRTHQCSACEKRVDERASRAQHIRNIDQRFGHALQKTPSTLLARACHGSEKDLRNSTISFRIVLLTDYRSPVHIQVAARYHDGEQVCDRRTRGGKKCFDLADSLVQKCGGGHGLAVVSFHFAQPDI